MKTFAGSGNNCFKKNLDAKEVQLEDFDEAMEKSKPRLTHLRVSYKTFDERSKEKQSEEIKEGLSYLGRFIKTGNN